MKYRSTWESYFHSSQGVIFVLDSSDRLRMELLKDELMMVMEHKDVVSRGVSFCLFHHWNKFMTTVTLEG